MQSCTLLKLSWFKVNDLIYELLTIYDSITFAEPCGVDTKTDEANLKEDICETSQGMYCISMTHTN